MEMGVLPYGVVFIALLGLSLLVRSLGVLRSFRQQIRHLFSQTRIQSLTWGMLFVPIVISIVVWVWLSSRSGLTILVKWAYLTFMLGTWLTLLLAMFLLYLLYRLEQKPSVAMLSSPVLIVPLAAYLSPFQRFIEVFGTHPVVAMPCGVVMFLVGVLVIFEIRRELISSSPEH
jgi:hypothetical protein